MPLGRTGDKLRVLVFFDGPDEGAPRPLEVDHPYMGRRVTDAMSDTSQAPLLDEDYLILSTIHQNRGGQKEKVVCEGDSGRRA